jgi:hypothetical protein
MAITSYGTSYKHITIRKLVYRHTAKGHAFDLEKSYLVTVTAALRATATATLLAAAGTLDVSTFVNIS